MTGPLYEAEIQHATGAAAGSSSNRKPQVTTDDLGLPTP
ncbi:hypothetical protein GKJPGBOP_03421 [Streptomyces paromomycinus]|uniref:Uncharacterized protein n=1 Tax=Streptomyces paromomycinus TaxID=92743 RepID=A0A401W339_STREY|nr:hypothetical protein GKJPGBOP_03421 [Streptomyces paromomycinus]